MISIGEEFRSLHVHVLIEIGTEHFAYVYKKTTPNIPLFFTFSIYIYEVSLLNDALRASQYFSAP